MSEDMDRYGPMVTTQAQYFNALVNVASKADRVMELECNGGGGGTDWVSAIQELQAALELLSEIETPD